MSDETKKFEAQMEVQARAAKRELEGVLAELSKETTLRDKLLAEYRAAEEKVGSGAREKIEREELTRSKVARGEASLSDYLESGLKDADIDDRVKAETTGQLGKILALLREKGRRIFELEDEASLKRLDIAYFIEAGPVARLETMRRETGDYERTVGPMLESYGAAMTAREAAQRNYRLACGKSVEGLALDFLSLAQVEDLRFDARLAPEHLRNLEAFLASAPDPASHFNVLVKVRPGSPDVALDIVKA